MTANLKKIQESLSKMVIPTARLKLYNGEIDRFVSLLAVATLLPEQTFMSICYRCQSLENPPTEYDGRDMRQ